ncbi:hypothetical protein OsI_19417 [Oryza sativa Indica Group]|uniref:Late embryogenesis abundant protein LEA-2 subgroup domain-containing protein n=2 Tax=Oryza TaxID=4527 RepID=A0A0E0HCE1_ORYNI|nr:hypothetical protein OsI_19417 [Oryza sativa Indica Group]
MAAAAASSSSSSATLCKHHGPPTASRRRLRVCVAISVTALLLAAVVAAAVLAVAAARPRPADATVTALRLASLSVSPGGSVNATLDAVLAIRNPSPVAAFAHDAGRAEVYYRGALAADADVPPGRVAPRGSEALAVRLTVLADRLAGRAPELYGDVVGAAGDVPLTVRTTVPGTVTVLGVFRRHAVVITACDVALSVRRPGAHSSSCRVLTKL